ncbi:MAG: protoporphyrinogen/coproporphyrinogen oxidase [Saccharofermentanales bacterium]
MKKAKYLIIGAGISGLSFAFHKKNDDYIVLEKDKVCGGLARSFFKDGFVWDVGGHFFHFHSDETKMHYERLMAGKHIRTVKKYAKVYYSDQFIDAPFQYNIHQLPTVEFIECLTDLYYADRPDGNLPFDEFVRRTYGKGIADKFLIPYNEKLYACKMNELERDSMGNFLPTLDFGKLMNFYRGSKGKTYNDTFSYPVNGCVEIINSLVDYLDEERIHLNEEVEQIDVDQKVVHTSKDTYEYEYLINSCALNQFVNFVGDYRASCLNYNQVLVLNLGFDKPSIDKKVSWVYFPGKELFYRIGFYNNIAGTDRLSLYAEISYKANERINIEEALERTLIDLKRISVIDEHKLVAYEPYIINPAYVHITTIGKEYTAKFIDVMQGKDVHMIGRYARWEYSAMGDSMEQAKSLAEKI